MKFCTDLFSWQTKEIFSLIAYTRYIIMHYIFFLASDLSLFVMWLNVIQLKQENIQIAFSIFHKILHDIENIWRTINTIAHIRRNGHLFLKTPQFLSSFTLGKLFAIPGTDNIRGHPSIFSCQMMAIVRSPWLLLLFIIPQQERYKLLSLPKDVDCFNLMWCSQAR